MKDYLVIALVPGWTGFNGLNAVRQRADSPEQAVELRVRCVIQEHTHKSALGRRFVVVDLSSEDAHLIEARSGGIECVRVNP